MKSWKKLALSLAFAAGFANSAQAADQGTLGTTSSGSTVITLTIQDLIQISGLNDLTFNSYSGSGDLDRDDDLCVYRNKAPGEYTVSATALGETSFVVKSGVDTIAYTVFFNDVTGTSGETSLSHGAASVTQTGANTVSSTCGGGSTANVHVRFAQAALQAAVPGAYSGTLVLTVNPV